jgi:hypothetical protein
MRQNIRILRSGLAMAAVLGLVALLPALAVAAPYRVKSFERLSGASPFPAGCPGPFDAEHIPGHELEPSITTNPGDPRNVIATWKQDVGGAAARSDSIAASVDGGRSWTRTEIPGLTPCTGGTADGASDPWVSAGADGTAYFIGAAATFATEPPPVSFPASRSTDGGRHWSQPVTVAAADPSNDKPAITGDPYRARRAYATWSTFEHDFSQFPFANLLRFARTEDAGTSWSAATVVDRPPPNALDIPSVIVVLPDRTLVAVFAQLALQPDFTAIATFLAARSRDDGRTWGAPATISSMPLVPVADPDHPDEGLPQPAFMSAAAGRDGRIYVAWERDFAYDAGAIDVASSADGGRSWRVAPLPGVPAYAFEPSLAVDRHGTVGVTWYDLRNDRLGDGPLTADVWFSNSGDGGRSWRQAHVAGPTDLRTSPSIASNRVGEYQGLAALGGRGFAAIMTLAAPYAASGPTDVYFARIAPG